VFTGVKQLGEVELDSITVPINEAKIVAHKEMEFLVKVLICINDNCHTLQSVRSASCCGCYTLRMKAPVPLW
jgi:hypothetical protein